MMFAIRDCRLGIVEPRFIIFGGRDESQTRLWSTILIIWTCRWASLVAQMFLAERWPFWAGPVTLDDLPMGL